MLTAAMLAAWLLLAPASERVPVPEMVTIRAGAFTMGADEGDEDARPAHRVSLDAFRIGKYEVTQQEYAAFVRDSGHRPPGIEALPSMVAPERADAFRSLAQAYAWHGGDPPAGKPRHPVVLVRHDDARAYCAWLSKRTGRRFRLPTEAEWEKAARGGHEGRAYPWGDAFDPARANHLPDPALKAQRGTQPVGSYEANGYGLHDVAGNAWEWVADWYAAYAGGTQLRNPRGPEGGDRRIVRGGAWLDDDIALLKVTHRHEVPADAYSYSVGFRVVEELARY